MNAADRESETIDFEPYEGKPDFPVPQAFSMSDQDDLDDPIPDLIVSEDPAPEDVKVPDDIEAGEPVGSDLTPEIEEGSQMPAPKENTDA